MGVTREQKRVRLELLKEGKKRCSEKAGCAQIKTLDEFYTNGNKIDGREPCCIECCKRKSQERLDRAGEREKIRTRQRNKRLENPLASRLLDGANRVKKAGGVAIWFSVDSLLDYWQQEGIDAEVCYYCKQTVNTDDLQLDHGIPVIKGGTHTVENLFPSHKRCNMSKKDRTVEEYLEHLMQVA